MPPAWAERGDQALGARGAALGPRAMTNGAVEAVDVQTLVDPPMFRSTALSSTEVVLAV